MVHIEVPQIIKSDNIPHVDTRVRIISEYILGTNVDGTWVRQKKRSYNKTGNNYSRSIEAKKKSEKLEKDLEEQNPKVNVEDESSSNECSSTQGSSGDSIFYDEDSSETETESENET